jgi:uncharacterized protein YbaP (TraB family)
MFANIWQNNNKNKLIVRYLVIFLLLLLSTPLVQAGAQSNKHFLWSVSDESGLKMYLLGSVHMAQQKIYPLDPAIENAFNQSTDLIVEIDTAKIEFGDLLQKVFNLGMYSGNDSIWQHLDPETTKLLKACLAKLSLPEDFATSLRPWFLAMTLGTLGLKSLGYDENLGLDQHFVDQANEKGLPVHELESVSEQTDVFIALDEVASIYLLKSTLLEFEQLESQMESIFVAWQNGDVKGFEVLYFDTVKQHPELKPIFVKLIDERNIKMAERIKPHIQPGRVPFIVVGSAHLVGEKGLLAAFKAEGYTVEQL